MKKNKNIPKGTRDIIFDKCAKKREIENKLEESFKKEGFSEIITPSLEYLDVFAVNKAFDLNGVFKLSTAGNTMALRADCTAPIARVVATRLSKKPLPLKLYYNQNIFRASQNDSAKPIEATQCGVEFIGDGDIKTDTYIISTAIKSLKEIKATSFKIEISHAGLFEEILNECDLSEDNKELIRYYIETKNFAELSGILIDSKESAKKIERLSSLFGDIDILEKADELFSSTGAKKILSYLKELYKNLEAEGFKDYIMFDLGLMQTIEYYTGIVFKGYVSGSGVSILSGGRYDSLLSNYGLDVPACGFAIDVDYLMDIKPVEEQKNRPLRIALTKGRLEKKAVELFEKNGIMFDSIYDKGRKLIFQSNDQKIEIMLAKASDVITYVERGVCDLGVVGKDTIMELGSSFYEILDLEFGKCRFALAGKTANNFYEGYEKKIIATKYPKVAQEFFAKKGIDIETIKIEGSVELAPLLSLCDAIVDIVETGDTLRENGLCVYEYICDISARLIANAASIKLRKQEIYEFLDKI